MLLDTLEEKIFEGCKTLKVVRQQRDAPNPDMEASAESGNLVARVAKQAGKATETLTNGTAKQAKPQLSNDPKDVQRPLFCNQLTLLEKNV